VDKELKKILEMLSGKVVKKEKSKCLLNEILETVKAMEKGERPEIHIKDGKSHFKGVGTLVLADLVRAIGAAVEEFKLPREATYHTVVAQLPNMLGFEETNITSIMVAEDSGRPVIVNECQDESSSLSSICMLMASHCAKYDVKMEKALAEITMAMKQTDTEEMVKDFKKVLRYK